MENKTEKYVKWGWTWKNIIIFFKKLKERKRRHGIPPKPKVSRTTVLENAQKPLVSDILGILPNFI